MTVPQNQIIMARVYLNPDAATWFDYSSPYAVDTVWRVICSEGVLVTPAFCIPKASIHHIAMLTAMPAQKEEKPRPTLVPFTPPNIVPEGS